MIGLNKNLETNIRGENMKQNRPVARPLWSNGKITACCLFHVWACVVPCGRVVADKQVLMSKLKEPKSKVSSFSLVLSLSLLLLSTPLYRAITLFCCRTTEATLSRRNYDSTTWDGSSNRRCYSLAVGSPKACRCTNREFDACNGADSSSFPRAFSISHPITDFEKIG